VVGIDLRLRLVPRDRDRDDFEDADPI